MNSPARPIADGPRQSAQPWAVSDDPWCEGIVAALSAGKLGPAIETAPSGAAGLAGLLALSAHCVAGGWL